LAEGIPLRFFPLIPNYQDAVFTENGTSPELKAAHQPAIHTTGMADRIQDFKDFDRFSPIHPIPMP
jgi:hypothetical protein